LSSVLGGSGNTADSFGQSLVGSPSP